MFRILEAKFRTALGQVPANENVSARPVNGVETQAGSRKSARTKRMIEEMLVRRFEDADSRLVEFCWDGEAECADRALEECVAAMQGLRRFLEDGVVPADLEWPFAECADGYEAHGGVGVFTEMAGARRE